MPRISPDILQADADSADSLVGKAEQIIAHLTAAQAGATYVAGGTTCSRTAEAMRDLAESIRCLLLDEAHPALHLAEDAANEARGRVEDAFPQPWRRAS